MKFENYARKTKAYVVCIIYVTSVELTWFDSLAFCIAAAWRTTIFQPNPLNMPRLAKDILKEIGRRRKITDRNQTKIY